MTVYTGTKVGIPIAISGLTPNATVIPGQAVTTAAVSVAMISGPQGPPGVATNIISQPTQTSNFTAVPNSFYPVNATSGNITATLPTSTPGQIIDIKKSDSSNNLVNIVGTINGASTTLPLRLQNQAKYLIADQSGGWNGAAGDLSLSTLDNRYANLASPAFTGTPTAPTPATTDNSNTLANTSFVQAAILAAASTYDDVLDYASMTNFPASGSVGILYVANDTNYIYRWGGSAYTQVGGQTVSDATTTSKGIIRLNPAGDFDSTSTADLPIIKSASSTVAGKTKVGATGGAMYQDATIVDLRQLTGDGTSALQAAINLASTPGTFVRILLPQVLNLTQPCVATNTTADRGAQIVVPYIADLTNSQMSYVELVGVGYGSGTPPTNGTKGDVPSSPSGSVIRSSGVGPLSGASVSSVIDTAAPTGSFTKVNLITRDVIVRLDATNQLSGLYLRYFCGFRSFGVLRADTNVIAGSFIPQPTVVNWGVCMPGLNNNGGAVCDEVYTAGFYNGVGIAEHTVIQSLGVYKSVNCMVILQSFHSATINYASLEWCNNYIVPDTKVGSTPFTPITILCADFEEPAPSDTSWYALAYHINDPNNYIPGTVAWTRVQSGNGQLHTLVNNGANSKLRLVEFATNKQVGPINATTVDASNQVPLTLTQNDVTNNPSALIINQNTSGAGIAMTGGAAGHALVEATFTGTTGGGNNVGGLNFSSTTATTAAGMNLSWNSANFTGVGGSGVLNVNQNNASASGGAIVVKQQGSGVGLGITGGSTGHALEELTFTGTTGGGNNVGGINVTSASATTAAGLSLAWNSDNFTGATGGYGLANIRQISSLATGNVLRIDNAGSGTTIRVNTSDLLLLANGNLGLGKTPTTKLDVNGVINVNSNKITSVADPTAAQDVATKNYVDTAASGTSKQSILTPKTIQTTSFTAVANSIYPCTGTITATLPTSTSGQWINVKKTDAIGTTVTVAYTLAGNATTLPLTTLNQAKTFYADGNGGWAVIDGDIGLDQLRLIFGQLAAVNTWSAANTFSVSPTVPTPTTGDNTTNAASTAFVQTAINAAVTGVTTLKGTIDCSTNPNYPSAKLGDTYIVSVAGLIGGASGVVTAVGDEIVATAANAGGTQVAVGSSWDVIPNVTDSLRMANNLSDVGSTATAFTNIKQSATSTTTGVLQLAGDLTGSATAPTLIAKGTAGTYAYPASITTDPNGRLTAVTPGAAPATYLSRSIVPISGITTGGSASQTDYIYYWSGSTGYTFTLPTAVGNTNRYTLMNKSTVSQSILFNGSQSADGSTFITIVANQTLEFISNNSNWMVA